MQCNNDISDNKIELLTYLLQTYHKFVFYDSIISIIKARDFFSIKMLFIMISDVLMCILDDYKFDDKMIKKYKKNADEVIDIYLNKDSNFDNALKESIQHIFKDKALKESSIQLLLREKLFIENLQKFIIAYNQLHKYANGTLSDLLTEFHNSMSHIIAALLHVQQVGQILPVYSRNIEKAIGHLKRGRKDAYKIIIRCLYPIISQYSNVLDEFKKEFIIIRCNEIDSLSDVEKHETVENSIQNLAEKYLQKLIINNTIENQEKFKGELNSFFLYKLKV